MTWNPGTETITVAEVLDLYPHLGVPHFQRGLVWGNDSVAALLESLFYDTPCGSFVLWDSGDNQNNGVPMASGSPGGIRYLIIDGQQRIRSLRQVFQNEGASDVEETGPSAGEEDERHDDKAWCINLTQLEDFRDILEPHNREYALFVYTTRPEKADVRSPIRKNILPLDGLLKDGSGLDPIQHLQPRTGRRIADLNALLPGLKTKVKAILQRAFFVTVKKDGPSPADMINLYNRINSGGKRVEVEERAFARLVALYPSSWLYVANIFKKVHGNRGVEGTSVDDHLSRDDVLQRQKENRFGFKLFIRTFIQVCNYHLDRSAGSQYLSFNVVHSDSFAQAMSGEKAKKMEFLWQEALETLVTVRNVLKQELFCDDLAFLPDTMSLVPLFQMLVQFPRLREQNYWPILGWATLSLLLANRDDNEILSFVARLRQDGELAEAVLPKMLKEWDKEARHRIRSPQTLESASSIQNRYVLLLYGLLRRNAIRDFSYKNLAERSPLRKQEEKLVCEATNPEKQHIAPFSCLVQALGDKDAKRGANHRFNNIGNLTYISAILNHYETGLGSTPIDRSFEPPQNLQAHYLSDDEKAGHLYDRLKTLLCGDEDSSRAETISRIFESFCTARRQLIARGFMLWLDDLSRRAEGVLVSDDAGTTASRLEAAIPQCIEHKYLRFTHQIRSLNYPNDIEDALVGYVRHIEEHHHLRKRRKLRENGEIELRLSDDGAVRLLMSSSEIRVVYRDRIPSDLKSAVDGILGLSGGEGCLYHRDRGGALTLEQLMKASSESAKIDAAPRPPPDPSQKKGPLDPAFAAVIDLYDQDAEVQWRARGGGLQYRSIYPDPWKGAVHYGFWYAPDSLNIFISLDSDESRVLEPHLAVFAGKKLATDILLEWYPPGNSRKRGYLAASLLRDGDPAIAVRAMNELIALTRNVIEKNLKS